MAASNGWLQVHRDPAKQALLYDLAGLPPPEDRPRAGFAR